MKDNEYIDVENDNEILEKNIDEIINCESGQNIKLRSRKQK